MSTTDRLVYYKLQHNSTPDIEFGLTISPSFSWQLHYRGVHVPTDCSLLADLPPFLCDVACLEMMFTLLSSSKPCKGNPDDRFLALLPQRDDVFRDRTGMNIIINFPTVLKVYTPCYFVGISVVARKESRVLSSPTIRHSKCKVLCGQFVERCDICTHYRKVLRATCSKQSHHTTPRCDPSSRVNYRFLSKNELQDRLHEVHSLQHNTSRKLQRLQARIAASTEKDGVDLDETSHADVTAIMEQCSETVTSKYPPNSFQQVFWQQQLQAASLSNNRRRRWHPLMIKWALYLRHLSGKAYETIRESGCLALPSQRTLRDYTYFLESTLGFSDAVDKHLMQVAKVNEIEDFQKCIAVIMDEMHIKEDLVFSKHSGNLIGFTNLGNINDLLLRYEHSLESESNSSTPLAKAMLVFYVRGLFTSVQFPYAQFASKTLSGDLIFQPFWEAVFRLERMGFRVTAATADGASPNRSFFALHSNDKLTHKTLNPYAHEDRYIYFFSDPPHLLKTTRNCLASKNRNLRVS